MHVPIIELGNFRQLPLVAMSAQKFKDLLAIWGVVMFTGYYSKPILLEVNAFQNFILTAFGINRQVVDDTRCIVLFKEMIERNRLHSVARPFRSFFCVMVRARKAINCGQHCNFCLVESESFS